MNISAFLVILDLDETLIHTSVAPRQNQIAIRQFANYWLYERPYVHAFIKFCLANFRVAVWTSSSERYAQAITAHLFEHPEQLEFIWSRQHCTVRQDPQSSKNVYIKNLKKVKARGEPLSRVVIVDDSPEKLIYQYGNLVPISPFEGQANDTALLLLMDYLLHLSQQPNVRSIDKRGWQQHMVHQAVSQYRAELYANDATLATGKLI